MKLNKQTIIIMVVFVAVVAVAVFAFLVFPRFGELSALDDDIALAEADIASANTLLARRVTAKANSAQTESQLMRIANELPESPQLPSVIIELQDIMNRQGLEFTSMNFGKPAADPEEGYSSVAISLAFDGRWVDVVTLLQDFPRMNRQVRVTDYSVTRMAPPESDETTPVVEDEPEERVRVRMTIEVYTMALVEAAGGTAAPAAPAQ
ncbi:MAG: type 4a pilus biogenesis protein PilO [Actinomycetota bacterium]|jgi:Tfp pilus assembly protein PilO|nr:type 4a pilus biogenesis protein PilO [Actinomycetota bacterium]